VKLYYNFLFFLSFLVFNPPLYSKSISCSVWYGQSDGEINSPEGHSVNYGLVLGVSNLKIVCEEGYVIAAPNLYGIVLSPGIHSQKINFSCFGSEDLKGDYFGVKADISVGFEVGAGIIFGSKKICTLSGAGFGIGANIVAGHFQVTHDPSRVMNARLYKSSKLVLNSWTYKKCRLIKKILDTKNLSKNTSYQLSRVFLIAEKCPVQAGFFPANMLVQKMARQFNIVNELSADNYNHQVKEIIQLMKDYQLTL